MIRCENLEKRYGNSTALRNFSFTFAPGHIYALLGPNGSGKSTLMKSLAGLVKPSAGRIMVEDHELSYKDKQTIAYMPTEPYFYNYMTAMQVAKYYQDFFTDFSMDKFTWTMSRLGLDPAKKVAAYSTGMMAKFKVALNVSRNPKLLMLDEPLNGIDMLAREEVAACIMQGIDRNAIVMISSHLIEDLERIADYVIFLKEGDLVLNGFAAGFREQYGKSMTDMYRDVYGSMILNAGFGYPGQVPIGMQGGYPGQYTGQGVPGQYVAPQQGQFVVPGAPVQGQYVAPQTGQLPVQGQYVAPQQGQYVGQGAPVQNPNVALQPGQFAGQGAPVQNPNVAPHPGQYVAPQAGQFAGQSVPVQGQYVAPQPGQFAGQGAPVQNPNVAPQPGQFAGQGAPVQNPNVAPQPGQFAGQGVPVQNPNVAPQPGQFAGQGAPVQNPNMAPQPGQNQFGAQGEKQRSVTKITAEGSEAPMDETDLPPYGR